MPEKDDYGPEVEKALEILGRVFVAHHHAADAAQPRKEPFDFATAGVAAQATAILGSVAEMLFVCSDLRRGKIVHHSRVWPGRGIRLGQ